MGYNSIPLVQLLVIWRAWTTKKSQKQVVIVTSNAGLEPRQRTSQEAYDAP